MRLRIVRIGYALNAIAWFSTLDNAKNVLNVFVLYVWESQKMVDGLVDRLTNTAAR
jgi:ABC-type proline/glycine betaine transport system ATPase subunit